MLCRYNIIIRRVCAHARVSISRIIARTCDAISFLLFFFREREMHCEIPRTRPQKCNILRARYRYDTTSNIRVNRAFQLACFALCHNLELPHLASQNEAEIELLREIIACSNYSRSPPRIFVESLTFVRLMHDAKL